MDFPFFENLSKIEAKDFLATYLKYSSDNYQEFIKNNYLTNFDYTIESIFPFFELVLPKLKTIKKEEDPSLPLWIKENKTYQDFLFDFDDNSKRLIYLTSYYLGQSFVKSYDRLKWSVGDKRYAFCNMPVVSGFNFDIELPVLVVTKNCFSKAIVNPKTFNNDFIIATLELL